MPEPAANPASRPIAITAGEPAGIGPELIVRLASEGRLNPAVVVADPRLLEQTASRLGIAVPIGLVEAQQAPRMAVGERAIHCLPVACPSPLHVGRLNPKNAPYVLKTLDVASDGCLNGLFSAMVTAPLHKGVINQAGIEFTGHTEYLARRSGTPKVVMMLLNQHMRVALATTHLPLRAVADAITVDSLRQVLTILLHDMRTRFGLENPRIAVCGLNPHAGESGVLGREEIEIIEPVITELQQQGHAVFGPVPADTLFTPARLENTDAVLAMYHDQGLAPLKYAGFGQSVNLTLGLPFVRTSVDHGTALDIAGQGVADTGSLQAAIALARQLTAGQTAGVAT